MMGGTLRAPGWGGKGERGRTARRLRTQSTLATGEQNPLS
jgi:hypothetical protein